MIIFFIFLLSSCSSVFYQPIQDHYKITPDKFGYQKEEHWISVDDNLKLHAWRFPAKGSYKATVVQFHGNAENMSTHFLSLAWMVEYGFDVWTFDYRSYGKSQGKPSQKLLAGDGVKVIHYIHQQNSKKLNSQLVLFGMSLGGAILQKSLEQLKEKIPIKLLVLDSTFNSYKKLAAAKMRAFWFTYLLSPLGYMLVEDEGRADDFYKINYPLLVIHAKDDPVVPFKFGEEIYKNSLAQIKHFWSLDSHSHTSVFFIENNSYRLKFIELVNSLN